MNRLVDLVSFFLFSNLNKLLDFELDDTISSWFQITMLHVWMILVRISDSSKQSEYFKHQVIKRMWEDLSIRISKLGVN